MRCRTPGKKEIVKGSYKREEGAREWRESKKTTVHGVPKRTAEGQV